MHDDPDSPALFLGTSVGRVNANRAVLAARAAITNPGSLWPEPAGDFAATQVSPGQVQLSWRAPRDNPEGMLILVGSSSIRWRPREGERFRAGDVVAGNARVAYQGRATGITVAADQVNPSYCAAFAYSADYRYSWRRAAKFTPAPATPSPVAVGAPAHRSPARTSMKGAATPRRSRP